MRKLTACLILVSTYLGLIGPIAADGQISGRAINNRVMNVPPGLTFRLSAGSAGPESHVVQPPAKADPISYAESAGLLKRLPSIKSDPDDQAEFAKRIGTLSAPKTGRQIPVKFPSDADRALPNAATASAALEVVRFSPEGAIPFAPDLSVTFSQPMVAVTSQDEAAMYAPVELSPSV